MTGMTCRKGGFLAVLMASTLLGAGCFDGGGDSGFIPVDPGVVTLLPQYQFTITDSAGGAGALTLDAQLAGNPATVNINLGASLHGMANLQTGDWLMDARSDFSVDATGLGSFSVDVTSDIVFSLGDTPVSGELVLTSDTEVVTVSLSADGVVMSMVPVSARIVASITWTAGNGHSYAIVNYPGETWDSARADLAVLLPDFYLATITSAEEQAFLVDMVAWNSPGELWLGGAQVPITETDPAAGWTWVTGEPWVYTNWASGEPNDAGVPGTEQYLAIEFFGWNDEGSAIGAIGGYLAEGPGQVTVSWADLEAVLDGDNPAWMKRAVLATMVAEFVLGQAYEVVGIQELVMLAMPDQNPVTEMCDAFTGAPPAGVLNQGMFEFTWLGSGDVASGDSFSWTYTDCWFQETDTAGTLFNGGMTLQGYVLDVNTSGEVVSFGFAGTGQETGGVLFDAFTLEQTQESKPGVNVIVPSETVVVSGGVSVLFFQ
jgi:hypothetical protein